MLESDPIGVDDTDLESVKTPLRRCRRSDLLGAKTVEQALQLLRKCGLEVELYRKKIVQFLQDNYYWPLDAGQAGVGQLPAGAAPVTGRWAGVDWQSVDSILQACQRFYDMDAYDGRARVSVCCVCVCVFIELL